jgi:hypothetical protein
VSAVSRKPNQFRVVGDSLVGGEIPILRVPKECNMTIKKDELRAIAM